MKFYYERCKDRHGPLKSACQCFCSFFSWTFVKCTNKLYLLLFLCAVYVYTFSVRGFFPQLFLHRAEKNKQLTNLIYFIFFFSLQTEKTNRRDREMKGKTKNIRRRKFPVDVVPLVWSKQQEVLSFQSSRTFTTHTHTHKRERNNDNNKKKTIIKWKGTERKKKLKIYKTKNSLSRNVSTVPIASNLLKKKKEKKLFFPSD